MLTARAPPSLLPLTACTLRAGYAEGGRASSSLDVGPSGPTLRSVTPSPSNMQFPCGCVGMCACAPDEMVLDPLPPQPPPPPPPSAKALGKRRLETPGISPFFAGAPDPDSDDDEGLPSSGYGGGAAGFLEVPIMQTAELRAYGAAQRARTARREAYLATLRARRRPGGGNGQGHQ